MGRLPLAKQPVATTTKTKPLFVALDNSLKERLIRQAERLFITQTAFTKMALIRMIEEEEQIQENSQFRRVK